MLSKVFLKVNAASVKYPMSTVSDNFNHYKLLQTIISSEKGADIVYF